MTTAFENRDIRAEIVLPNSVGNSSATKPALARVP